MKKILCSLLAIGALASCAKTEAFYTEENSEIKIKPATTLSTRANVPAAIDGTTYPVAENFDVYGYWANKPAGSSFTDGTLYLGQGGAYEFVNKGNYWGGKTPYYWPKNGSLRFAAYSPSSINMTHDLATDTYTVEGYVQPSNTAETWDLLVAPTTKSYTAMTAAENVSVVFQHALSWITVKMVAKDATAAKAFDVKKVTINGVKTVATLNAAMGDGIQVGEWSEYAQPKAYVVYEGSQAVTEVATVVENVTNGTLVIPQATTSITIDYTQNALEGTPALENQTLTLDLVLDTDNTPWEPGKHYNYTLVFGLDEILINPSVADWEEVVVNDAEVGTTNVYSVAQLATAFKNGGTIVLQEDLDATSLTVKKDAVLELNGHTITGADNVTGSYGLINVSAGVSLTVNGPGTLTATATNNRNWNAYSSVISNQRGLLVVNEGVVVEHLGGTDMAYGIDNLTNGKKTEAVTIVNGATVKSTYRAIRQFLNGVEANNELQVKAGSKIIGANKSIWSHDPSANANSGKLVVEEGAELDGDVYLFVTAGSTEWPVEAYIPASTLVNGSTVVSGNVPAGYGVALVNGVYTIVKGATGVATAEEFAAAMKSEAENISIILTDNLEVPISSLGQQTGGSGEYKLGGENTKNITIDLNGNKLNITSNYWSVLGAKNADAIFTIKNGTMTSSQASGTWNSYDLCFANCNYVLEDVVFDKAIALEGKSYILKNVTINETHNYYAMWISAKGQIVDIDGLTINSLGRGIKIDEQYVSAPAHVTLKVKNAVVKSNEKAAIVVKSVAGANITLENVNIAEVAEDSDFAVWVDEDSAAYADKVVVVGGLCKVEGSNDLVVDSAEDFTAGVGADATVYVAAGSYTFPSKVAAGATIICEEGVVFEGLTKLNINGSTVVGATFSNPTGTAVDQTIYGTFKNCTFEGKETLRWCYTKAGQSVVFENCVIKTTLRGVHFDGMDGDVTFKNCEINGFNAYSGAGTMTFEGCTFGHDQSRYNGLNIYSNTVLKNCHFAFVSGNTNFIDLEGTGKALTISGCTATLDGATANVRDFVGGSKLANNTVTIDGVAL